MDEETKEKLKHLPKKRCSVCNSVKSYLNPLEKCDECGKLFCYDHINSMQFKKGMKQIDALRNVCDECKAIHKYSIY